LPGKLKDEALTLALSDECEYGASWYAVGRLRKIPSVTNDHFRDQYAPGFRKPETTRQLMKNRDFTHWRWIVAAYTFARTRQGGCTSPAVLAHPLLKPCGCILT